jgi:hypothetical protein
MKRTPQPLREEQQERVTPCSRARQKIPRGAGGAAACKVAGRVADCSGRASPRAAARPLAKQESQSQAADAGMAAQAARMEDRLLLSVFRYTRTCLLWRETCVSLLPQGKPAGYSGQESSATPVPAKAASHNFSMSKLSL